MRSLDSRGPDAGNTERMQSRTTRLDPLTSLRFFAAAMIVVLHVQALGLFGVKTTGIAWGHGVSFFFVLSGFILTYVYPSLDAEGATLRFWRARVARIWPAYLASFLLGYWLLSYRWEAETGVPHLLMLQGWVPLSKYFFSYNAVSWSVSVELLFYLLFPLLVSNLDRNWWIKLALSGGLVVVLVVIADRWSLPALGAQWSEQISTVVTREGLLVNNPLPRVFEFVFGMCVALAWRRSRPPGSFALATVRELGAVALCVASVLFTSSVVGWWQRVLPGTSLSTWWTHSGSMFAFGLLIFVMAQGKGAVSRLLSHPALVLLGEISFSIYLIHQILLVYMVTHLAGLTQVSRSLALAGFVTTLLLGSYLLWVYVEMPGRRWIVGGGAIHGSPAMAKSWSRNTPLSRRPLTALVLLLGVGAAVAYDAGRGRSIDARDVGAMTPQDLKAYAGTNFGTLFTLRGIAMECKADGLHLRLAWQSHAPRTAPYTTAVHLIDATGKIVAQADHRQSLGTPVATAGTIRLDTEVIPPGSFKDGTVALALGLFDDKVNLLPIDRGPRDWEGRRLIVPVTPCRGQASSQPP